MSLGLQWWIFAMQYFESAIRCQLRASWWTSDKITKLKHIVSFLFLFCAFVCVSWLLITFPGYTSPLYEKWFLTTQKFCYMAVDNAWLVLNLASAGITAVSLNIIFKTINELKS